MNTLIFTLFFTIWRQSTGLMVTVTDTGLLVSVLFNWLRLNSPAGIPIRYLRLRANHNFALTPCAWVFPVNCLTLKLGKDRIGNLLCEPSTDVPATDGPARSLIRTKFREGTWMINANVHKAVCWLFILALEPQCQSFPILDPSLISKSGHSESSTSVWQSAIWSVLGSFYFVKSAILMQFVVHLAWYESWPSTITLSNRI